MLKESKKIKRTKKKKEHFKAPQNAVKKIKTQKKNFLYYLNHKNLIGEIEFFGFSYSWKNLALMYVIALALAIIAGVAFKLSVIQIAIIMVVAICVTPQLIKDGYTNLYQQKRFSDVNRYIEKMLYYFKTKPIILDCLDDVRNIFPEGPMKKCVDNAREHIRFGTTKGNIKDEALDMISKEYSCRRIDTLHTFLMSVERNGGTYDTSTKLLLDDRKLWTDRTIEMQNAKKQIRTNVLFSIILSAALCLALMYVPTMIGSSLKLADISQYPIVSWANTLFIILMILVYVKADKSMCMDLLDDNDKTSEESAAKEYYKIINYDADKEFNTSIKWAIGTGIFFALLFVLIKSPIVIFIGLAAILFMLNQHKIGHSLARKTFYKKLEIAFPEWLMDVSLLLQSENVRVSLSNSFDNAPNVLRPALHQMLVELSDNPDADEPYEHFLNYFNMPDVQDAMSTLYSISTGAGGNVEVEFKNIIERTNTMMSKAEQLRNKDKLAGLKIYVTLPNLIGAFEMMVGMCALLMAFFTMTV